MDSMKRRWTTLFWMATVALAGVSWMAVKFGISLSSLMNVGMIGMMAAWVVALYAMIRSEHHKWPAAVVLGLAGPMTLELVDVVPHIMMLVQYLGPSVLLIVFGTFATVACAIVLLARPLPPKPQADPIARARVV